MFFFQEFWNKFAFRSIALNIVCLICLTGYLSLSLSHTGSSAPPSADAIVESRIVLRAILRYTIANDVTQNKKDKSGRVPTDHFL
jgi:hypothetical protein